MDSMQNTVALIISKVRIIPLSATDKAKRPLQVILSYSAKEIL